MTRNFNNLFNPESISIQSLLSGDGLGFRIPLYQREYSWGQDNVDQLFDDICNGVENFLQDEEDVCFLGTIIRVTENKNKYRSDYIITPTSVDHIVDGQQRLSTISLILSLIYIELHNLRRQISKNEKFSDLVKTISGRLNSILNVFAFTINEEYKPRIVRVGMDKWVEGNSTSEYKSPIAKFTAELIALIESSKDDQRIKAPTIENSVLDSNRKRIENLLEAIQNSHIPKVDDEKESAIKVTFPDAESILSPKNKNKDVELGIWNKPRPDLSKIILDLKESDSDWDVLCRIVQILAFSSYLLRNCCCTVIRCDSEKWAFDVFQSLNATGTPLTAMETFKPTVMNLAEMHDEGYSGKPIENSFKAIDIFLSGSKKDKKDKNTNQLLTTFAHAYNGEKLARRFSVQRKWLEQHFATGQYAKEERLDFVRKLGYIATYLDELDNDNPNRFTHLKNYNQKDIECTSFCNLFLDDANHSMAQALLSRFYSEAVITRSSASSIEEFVLTSKAIAAFFTLWRSALPNTGLDEIYRIILKGNDKYKGLAWSSGIKASSVQLKAFFRDVLGDDKRRIGTKEEWKSKSSVFLRYDTARTICKFVLFLVANETEPDGYGLMKKAKPSLHSYLNPILWKSPELKTVEHIAPQENRNNWDSNLYTTDIYQSIGNLTLLPLNLNASLGNHSWKTKYFYFQVIGKTRMEEIENLKNEAKSQGIELAESTIAALQQTTYLSHIQPIVDIGYDGIWDAELVKNRTDRILDIVWDRLWEWLN
jgi:hypothetical protein